MDGGGRAWGKGEEKPARRGYWKTKYPLILPLISCVPLHFRKWAGNQSKWVKLKTESTLYWLKKKTHVEPISETVRWSFFSRQYLLHGHKYELIFAALYIFLSIAAVIYLTVLLPFEGNFEAKKTNAFEGLPTMICLIQTGTLWWNSVAGFFPFFFLFINEKMATANQRKGNFLREPSRY